MILDQKGPNVLTTIIGDILPLTLGIAISPLTIVAVMLMLLSPQARRTGPGFLVGWVAGTAIPVSLFVFFAGLLPPHADSTGPNAVQAVIHFALALLLILLAVKEWRGRPQHGEAAPLPKWMAAIDSFTFGRAIGLGLVLSVPRPKNLLIAASAGVLIGGAGLSTGAEVTAVTVFVLCAVSTVLVPVVAFFAAADRLRAPLEAAHQWLARENAVITTVLLTVIAVIMLGKGISAL